MCGKVKLYDNIAVKLWKKYITQREMQKVKNPADAIWLRYGRSGYVRIVLCMLKHVRLRAMVHMINITY